MSDGDTIRKIADELHKAYRMGVLPERNDDRALIANAILLFDATIEDEKEREKENASRPKFELELF